MIGQWSALEAGSVNNIETGRDKHGHFRREQEAHSNINIRCRMMRDNVDMLGESWKLTAILTYTVR